MEAVIGAVFAALLVIAFVGWCWMVVRAFKAGGFGWGLLMLAGPSVATVIGMVFASPIFMGAGFALPSILGALHLARHEGDGKIPFALIVPGTIAVIVVVVLSLTGVMPQES